MKKLEENYKEFKERITKETNDLPLYWAFGKEQTDELMKKLNIKNDEELKEKCFTILGAIALLKNKELIINTFKRHNKELEEALKDKEFLTSAFRYEMSNHEYYITYDKSETLTVLGISYDDFMNNEIMQEAWKIAQDDYFKKMEEMGW